MSYDQSLADALARIAELEEEVARLREALEDIAEHRMPSDWSYPEPIDEELAWAQHHARAALRGEVKP